MSSSALNARNRYNMMSPAQKEARKAQMREYAKAHRPVPNYQPRVRANSFSRKEWATLTIITKKLELASCTDCGLPCEEWNHVMFAFDHLDPALKLFSLSKAAKVKGLTMEMLVAEFDKCQLVCHNCHAYRTFVERHHDCHIKHDAISGPEPLFTL